MPLTEWTDLLARLERDPGNDVLAAMLTDELMEARDMYRTEADRYVATARRAAQDSADMTWLANLITSKGPAYDLILAKIRSALAIYAYETLTLFVVAGTDEPRVGQVPGDVPEGALFHGFPVAIPATWARTWWASAGRPAVKPPADPSPPPKRVPTRRAARRPGPGGA